MVNRVSSSFPIGDHWSNEEVSLPFHLMYEHVVLVRSRLLSGHLSGKSCPLG